MAYSLLVLVWVEDGKGLFTLILVQEMISLMDGGQDSYLGVSFCYVVSDATQTCASAMFSTNGTNHQRVCGKAMGYQKGVGNGFHWGHCESQTIDGYYVQLPMEILVNICDRICKKGVFHTHPIVCTWKIIT